MSEAVVKQIEKAIHTSVEAFNNGDMAIFLPYFRPDTTAFWPDEGDLVVADAVHNRYRTGAENGSRANLKAVDIDVQLHGDIALTTCYFRGTFNPPDGTVNDVAFRVSQVWGRKDGQWQIIHAHYSPRTLDS